MSIVLAWKSPEKSILITDTRTTNEDFSYSDNTIKLYYKENICFVAGVGSGNFLMEYSAQLSPESTHNNSELLYFSVLDAVMESGRVKENDCKYILGTTIVTQWITSSNEISYNNSGNQTKRHSYLCDNKIIMIHNHSRFPKFIPTTDDDVLRIMLEEFKKVSDNPDNIGVSNIACVSILTSSTGDSPIFHRDSADELLRKIESNIRIPNLFTDYKDMMVLI